MGSATWLGRGTVGTLLQSTWRLCEHAAQAGHQRKALGSTTWPLGGAQASPSSLLFTVFDRRAAPLVFHSCPTINVRCRIDRSITFNIPQLNGHNLAEA